MTKINLAFSVGVCVLTAVNGVWLVARNRRKEGERAVGLSQGGEEAEEAQIRCRGDDHPDIIYTL